MPRHMEWIRDELNLIPRVRLHFGCMLCNVTDISATFNNITGMATEF